ncbi:MAG: hypothetical protein KF767_00615 [Bdellovibrionaceae bacterium]|nr:hypothetical protein [Pseudobdellovibrionaceae bacterium]
MPNVSSKSQVVRSGNHNRADIHREHTAEKARDDLRTAYAGDENKGPAADKKANHVRSTSLSGRRIDQKRDDKEPVR